MVKIQRKGVAEARKQLSALLDEAEKGHVTVITHHGRSIAALAPIECISRFRQKSLTALAGSGEGMWDRDCART